MIIDKPTGIELIPGNGGKDCPGNGENGNEICCDECDYMCCCFHLRGIHDCNECVHLECPRNQNIALRLETIEKIKESLK